MSYSLSVYKLSISASKVAYKLDSASSVRTLIENMLEIIRLAEAERTIAPEIQITIQKCLTNYGSKPPSAIHLQ